jgi:hypothetical protein
MPRTKLQAEVDSWKPKYPDFESLPEKITSGILVNSYYGLSYPTARKFIENIPGHFIIGKSPVIAKRVFGRYTGEMVEKGDLIPNATYQIT